MAKTKVSKKSSRASTKQVATRKGPKKAAKRPAPAPSVRTVTPYLSVGDAAAAIEWYKRAFGAKETAREPGPSGKIMHAALKLGDSSYFLSDIFPGSDSRDPRDTGPSVTMHLWHKDADRIWQQAVDAGAKVTMPLEDQFWGDRYGKLIDPFGHAWSLARRSTLTKQQLEAKRVEAMRDYGMD